MDFSVSLPVSVFCGHKNNSLKPLLILGTLPIKLMTANGNFKVFHSLQFSLTLNDEQGIMSGRGEDCVQVNF